MSRLAWVLGVLAMGTLLSGRPTVADELPDSTQAKLAPGQLDRLWRQVEVGQDGEATEAMAHFIRAGDLALPTIQKNLCLPPNREHRRRIEQLVRDLDHNSFDAREQATRELIQLGRQSSLEVHRALDHPSLEVRRRAERILGEIFPLHNQGELRAVTILDMIGTAESRRLLRKLASHPANEQIGAAARAALARRGVPHAVAVINAQLASSWQAEQLKPARQIDDLGYLRRASLDLIGRIPTLEELRTFESDQAADKRARLIDRLLASEEYARHWAELWTGWLIGQDLEPESRAQLRNWLEIQLTANLSHRQLVHELLTASGRPDKNPAVHFLLANLGNRLTPGEEKKLGQFDMVPLTSKPMKLFLGIRIECTRCHDHPFNPEYRQRDFWGINSFYRQLELADNELKDNPGFNSTNYVTYEKRTRVVIATRSQFLHGGKPPPDSKKTRRAQLAEYVVSHPNFARAQVNRLWGQLFGRGLCIHPTYDDFGEHNELVHPELMDGLARDFVLSGHDTKQLLRWICASDAYQLASTANPTNIDLGSDVYFSRMPLKALTLEQVYDSLQVANPLPVGETDPRRHRAEFIRANRLAELFIDRAPVDDSFCCGCFTLPEVPDRGTAAEATRLGLRLINGLETNRQLPDKLRRAIDPDDPARTIDVLFLAVLTRYPTKQEQASILAELKQPADARRIWEDLYWALLNSNEFALNH
ncbi:MAG: DUF1549 domain-containing protein [Gemmataceae bacterium]